MTQGAAGAGPGVAPLVLCGEEMEVRADRTLYWPRRATLLVADLHLGQAATLGAQGVIIPRGTDAAALHRLGTAVRATGAERLLVLGDQYHHAWGQGGGLWAALRAFRAQHTALDWMLVEGNHDRRSAAGPPDLRITTVHEWEEGPFLFRHAPGPADRYVLGGHLHPGFQLGAGVRVPCFHFFERYGVVPAFGGLTGMVPLAREAGDRVVAIGEGALFFF